jgi:protein-tyrosine phosphatase
MVDIHAHILPGVDDGARTLEESLEMLRIAAQSGTTDIVATPHANAQFPYDPAKIQSAYETLRSAAEGITINIHLGADFHLSYVNLLAALAEPQRFTINTHQYLMVELPDFFSISFISDTLLQLLSSRFVPIITHPERNISLQADLKEVEYWVHQGVRIQITAQSMTGRFGSDAKRAADKLLKSKLVHFVASDAHDCSDRRPDLTAAYKYVENLRNRAEADALFIHNPAATLYGAPLIEIQKRPSKFSRLFS